MRNITKLEVYLNEWQYHKLCLIAEKKGVTPEQVANEAVYGYLATVDPSAVDYDDMTPAQQAEADRRYVAWCRSEGLDPYLEEEQKSTACYDSEAGNSLLQFDPLDPCVELNEDGYRR